MSAAAAPPALPLLRLRAAHADAVRPLLERDPAWGHAMPARTQEAGDRAVTCYRLSQASFWLQVHWRRRAEHWEERDVEVVAGSSVALRLVLDDVSPSMVTELLDLPPTRAFAKGDGGSLGAAVRDEGLWIHEVMPGAFCVPEEKVQELLAVLRSRPRWRDVFGHRGVRWAGVTVKLRSPLERPPAFALEPRVLEDLVGLSLALDLECAAG
jgi:hypothetical protein